MVGLPDSGHVDGRLSQEWESQPLRPIASVLAQAVAVAFSAERKPVQVDHVLAALGTTCPTLRTQLAPAWHDAISLVNAGPPEQSTLDIPSSDEMHAARTGTSLYSAAAMREGLLRAEHMPLRDSPPAEANYSAEVRQAVRRAVELSTSAGVQRTHAVHLLHAVLSDPQNRVGRLLSQVGVTGAQWLSRVPVDALSRREGLFSNQSAAMLDRRGRIRPGHLGWWRRVGKRISELPFEFRHGMLPGMSDFTQALGTGAAFESARLGHRWTGSAHSILAMLSLAEYLDTVGRRIPTSSRGDLNQGARILAAHGVTYKRAFEAAVTFSIDWRSLRLAPNLPAGLYICEELQKAGYVMRQRATERLQWYVGTTALLVGLLEPADSSANAFLHHLGVEPAAIAADASRQLAQPSQAVINR
jgi:hypothetical protein